MQLQAALYYDGVSPSKEHNVKKKKEVIGKECLGLLLDFFADGSKSSTMRQWVRKSSLTAHRMLTQGQGGNISSSALREL
jgi:hypothetical protein